MVVMVMEVGGDGDNGGIWRVTENEIPVCIFGAQETEQMYLRILRLATPVS